MIDNETFYCPHCGAALALVLDSDALGAWHKHLHCVCCSWSSPCVCAVGDEMGDDDET